MFAALAMASTSRVVTSAAITSSRATGHMLTKRCRSGVAPFVIRLNAAVGAARPRRSRMKYLLTLYGDESAYADMIPSRRPKA